MNAGGLFTGIGGIELACDQVFGKKINHVFFCEKDKRCQEKLRQQWPGVTIEDDITTTDWTKYADKSIDLIAGGDPCPIRARASAIHGSKHPDLSGYFLAVVGICRPRWVVRENVPASDDVDFAAALEAIGYRGLVIKTNAASFTGQRRKRDLIVASNQVGWRLRFREIYVQKHDSRSLEEVGEQSCAQECNCLTTRYDRYDCNDNYIFDGIGIRIPDPSERVALSGLPAGYLEGFSDTAVARMTGNCVVPDVIVGIAETIKIMEDCQQ